MRILLVNTLYAPNKIGGAEKSVQLLAEKFSELGHIVKVICLDKKKHSYEIKGVDINAIKLKNNYWPFEYNETSSYRKLLWHFNDANNKKYNNEFSSFIDSFKPDILFTNNLTGFSTNVWLIAKKYDVKIVHTLRDYSLQCPKTTKFKNSENCKSNCIDCRLLSITKKKHSQKVDYLVGISSFILENHYKSEYFKNVPSKVIYNGFDIIPKTKTKKINKEIVFGFIGQIKKSKGVELLIKSFCSLKEKNWKLLIAGDISNTTYLTYLKSLYNTSKIEFLGYVDSDTYFQQIDVLVVTSLWNEPFGRVVLESMINKTPVLATNVGGISELLSNNKTFLIDLDKEELINQLEAILLKPSLLNNFSFDKDFMNKFSVDETVKSYLSIFNKVIKSDK